MWASVTDSGVSNVVPVRLFRIKVGNERGLTNSSQTSSWNEIFTFGRGGVLTGFEENHHQAKGRGVWCWRRNSIKQTLHSRWKTRGEGTSEALADVIKWVERKSRDSELEKKSSKCLVQWFPLKLVDGSSDETSANEVGEAEDDAKAASSVEGEPEDVGIVCLSFQFSVEPKIAQSMLKAAKSFLSISKSATSNRHRRVSSHTPMYHGRRGAFCGRKIHGRLGQLHVWFHA